MSLPVYVVVELHYISGKEEKKAAYWKPLIRKRPVWCLSVMIVSYLPLCLVAELHSLGIYTHATKSV